MSLDEAFTKWYATQDHAGLPWQTSRDELFAVFYAGWHAHIEALKQTDMFPGTLDVDVLKGGHDYTTPDQGITPEEIYAFYPRKIGKQAAIKAIQKAIKATAPGKNAVTQWNPAEVLLQKVRDYAAAVATWPAADKQYIPHPATWFNRGSYDDDPKEWQRNVTASQFSKTH